MNKVGLGIITCNREDFYIKCLEHIPRDEVDVLLTVNDGDPYNSAKVVTDHKYIQHKNNKGVGVTKNEALKYLVDSDCDHIFLIEDDILINDKDVFQKYIETAYKSGLWHLMFGYHGPANKGMQSGGEPQPRMIVDYGDDCKVAFNHHCVGAFCYYHKGVIKNIGLMDETYKNAWEHVDHSYQVVKAGLLPAYWWWPDVANSYDYLGEQACSEDSSSIRWEGDNDKTPRKDWQENIQTGAQHFYMKNRFPPGGVPDTESSEVQQNLNFIQQTYSKEYESVRS